MQRLRSRWTIIALVPAVFLAGFGIVSALADGSDEPASAAADAPAESGAGPAIVTITGETGSGESPAATDVATTTEGSTDSGGAASATDGGRGSHGGAPPAPSPGEIVVDYGRWEGVFSLESLELQHGADETVVFGELHYLGGLDCPVGLVRVRVWLFAGGSALVGRTQWASVESTGEGAEVTGREPLPFEAHVGVDQIPDAAALRVTAAECL